VFNRIIVATDLTAQSKEAFLLAKRMLSPTGRLTAVHVLGMPRSLGRWRGVTPASDVRSYRELLDRQIEGARSQLVRQVAGFDMDGCTDVQIRVGDPATHIARLADRLRAEVILVGRGAGGELGPVAEAVVRLSGRTVMVAPVPSPRRKRRKLPTSHRPRRLAA